MMRCSEGEETKRLRMPCLPKEGKRCQGRGEGGRDRAGVLLLKRKFGDGGG